MCKTILELEQNLWGILANCLEKGSYPQGFHKPDVESAMTTRASSGVSLGSARAAVSARAFPRISQDSPPSIPSLGGG